MSVDGCYSRRITYIETYTRLKAEDNCSEMRFYFRKRGEYGMLLDEDSVMSVLINRWKYSLEPRNQARTKSATLRSVRKE
jgi:hypothetical protein